jgi:hypothetical protein
MSEKTMKETLNNFGLNPEKIIEQRKEQGKLIHYAAFDAVGKVVQQTLDFCQEKGFGNASKLYVMQGVTEPGLFAVALSISYPPDIAKSNADEVPFESVLFAALYTALSADSVTNSIPKQYKGREMEAAHKMFYALTGKVFRDCFIETCKCPNCRARRKIHGIRLNPDRTDRWL